MSRRASDSASDSLNTPRTPVLSPTAPSSQASPTTATAPHHSPSLQQLQELAEGAKNEGLDIYNLDPDGFDIVCESNGWSKEDFVLSRMKYTQMELFMLDFAKAPHIQYFPNLVHLKMVNIGLRKIQHFEKLRNLQSLWLSENFISTIEGLENCAQLRELYLWSNEIKKMENLHRLKNLEVLWLAQNKIEKIEGLEDLINLRSLWIGGNKIRSVENCFSGNILLEELNIADNLISSFREIPPLNCMANLSKLWFTDPMYGDNPICRLCNYQTFTVFHLKHIRQLDYAMVSPEQRAVAETTFYKKTMYYQMRIKTLRRNTQMLVKTCENQAQKRQDEISVSLDSLQRLRYELQREVAEFEQYQEFFQEIPNEAKDLFLPLVQKKLDGVDSLLKSKKTEQMVLTARMSNAVSSMQYFTESHAARLMVELNTGGNVRMEEGKTKELWYGTCAELVTRRFFPKHFEVMGIKGLTVSKVIRLHNRALRSQFDDKLDELVDVSNSNYMLALEYLFFADTRSSFDDKALNNIVEFGFPSSQFPDGIPLTNSVFLAEQLRLIEAFKKGEFSGRGTGDGSAFTSRILVAKVFLGKCAAERSRSTTTEASTDKKTDSNLTPLVGDPKINKGDYANTTLSVYRTMPGDNTQRIWYCFEPYLILPEYIIEVCYVPSSVVIAPMPPLAEWGEERHDEILQELTTAFPQCTKVDLQDFKLVAPYFLSFLNWERSKGNRSKVETSSQTAEILAAEPHFDPREALKNPLITSTDIVSRVVASPSTRAEWSTLPTLASECDVTKAEPSLLSTNFKYLNLCGRSVHTMANVLIRNAMRNITTLILAFNEIDTIDPQLAIACPVLTHLDLSYNHIKKIEHLTKLAALTTLHLNHNLLFRIDEIHHLDTLPMLKDLSLKGNQFCATTKRYRPFVLSHLMNVTTLDGLPRRLEEEGSFLPMTHQLLLYCGEQSGKLPPSHMQLSLGLKLTIPDWLEMQLQEGKSSPKASSSTEELPSREVEVRLGRISFLHLLQLNISKINTSCFQLLTTLTCLNLSGNFLTSMEGVGCLLCLKELYLEDNYIRKIEDLLTLKELKTLELGRNRITHITGLVNCTNLCLLSLEENEVDSIAPLAQLNNITEVYLCRNKVHNGKEVNLLRELPKLIILDLSGNPCTSNEESYRLHTIFQLKKLKVLDGLSIDAAETAQAKDTFAGRINADLLNERLDGASWKQTRELSLSSCALKEITMMESFVSLQHLKLDHNLLSDVSGLEHCTGLLSLNLSHNKLGNVSVGKVLEKMHHLESMSLEANQIQSVCMLQLRLPKLKFLNLKCNEIAKIEGLEQLPQLREIHMDKNRLRSVDKESFLYNPLLREFYAEENAIKTIDGVKNLPLLYKISLAANRISDMVDLERGLDGLQNVIEICCLGNSVARKGMYRPHIVHLLPSLLVVDNREVSPEERERAEQLFQHENQIPPHVFTDVRTPVMGATTVTLAMPQPPQPKSGLRLISLEGMTEQLLGGQIQGGSGGYGSPSIPPAPTSMKYRVPPPTQNPPMGKMQLRTGSADLRPRPKIGTRPAPKR